MAAEAVGVEQRRCRRPACSFSRIAASSCRRRGELQRQRFVVGEAVGDQLGQTDGCEQARRHARHEGLARQRDQRQAGPQRVACRGVGVDREGVEKQIGQAMAGKMGVEIEARREHQAVGRDAARLGMAAQVVRRSGIVLQQPQHAALDLAQQTHPDVEHRRPDLVAVVERAEDEAALAASPPRRGWACVRRCGAGGR